jgi:putative ABC transport system permease protein
MHEINFLDLVWIFIPIAVVYAIYLKWTNDRYLIANAMARMFIQLILIGYVLTFIFNTKNVMLVLLILTIMLVVAAIIALRPVAKKNSKTYLYSFVSIAFGGIITLGFVMLGILDLALWYEPRYIIPLAGMIFSNSMNSISLSAERFEVEFERENNYEKARNTAYSAALIPNINTFFAVGLVSIPGMMTGQILSGVSPLIAVKYQIMVMCMILASSGLSVALYLTLLKKYKSKDKNEFYSK